MIDKDAEISRLAAELAAEKTAHSCTIAEEHESRSAFQERIRELEITEAAAKQYGALIDRVEQYAAGNVTGCGTCTTVINEIRSFEVETPVSTLCAVCDQIKELHPSTHPWTAKPTAETLDEQCKHGNGEDCPECAQIRAARTSRDRAGKQGD